MPVNIHGKQYITVAERVAEAHKEKTLSITTEVLPNGGGIVVKATVTTVKGTFTGISAANPDKTIEKLNPYEVAETSAVGRALGFAGYGIVEGIASADEMVKAKAQEEGDYTREPIDEGVGVVAATSKINWKRCAKHGKNYNGDKYSQCYECTREPAVTPDSQAHVDAF